MTSQNNAGSEAQGFIFSNKVYSAGKWISMVLLPAVSTFYFTLSGVWNLPYVTQVIGTLAALGTFIGVLLGFSAKAYNKSDARYGGSIDVETNEDDVKLFSLNLNGYPEDLDKRKEITFKINPPT